MYNTVTSLENMLVEVQTITSELWAEMHIEEQIPCLVNPNFARNGRGIWIRTSHEEHGDFSTQLLSVLTSITEQHGYLLSEFQTGFYIRYNEPKKPKTLQQSLDEFVRFSPRWALRDWLNAIASSFTVSFDDADNTCTLSGDRDKLELLIADCKEFYAQDESIHELADEYYMQYIGGIIESNPESYTDEYGTLTFPIPQPPKVQLTYVIKKHGSLKKVPLTVPYSADFKRSAYRSYQVSFNRLGEVPPRFEESQLLTGNAQIVFNNDDLRNQLGLTTSDACQLCNQRLATSRRRY